jgi:hypothetical protein
MKKTFILVIVLALQASIALAQTSAQPAASAPQAPVKLQFAPGTIIRIELAKSIDAKKAKVGDQVVGKTMDDFMADDNIVLAPRGAAVLAHVAEVAAHQGDSASTLGIAFDKMALKDGSDVPLKVVIQAIGRPESNAAIGNDPMSNPGNTGGMSSAPSGGRGSYGGMAPAQSASKASDGNAGAATQDPKSDAVINGRLTPNARGVVGISGVSLSTGSAQDSLLSSQKHNVKLDSGTQMILRVAE